VPASAPHSCFPRGVASRCNRTSEELRDPSAPRPRSVLLGAWRYRVGAHNRQLSIKGWQAGAVFRRRYSLYNTVVLEFRAPDRLREATHLLEPKAAEVETTSRRHLFLAR
jgi:hypothetical protein